MRNSFPLLAFTLVAAADLAANRLVAESATYPAAGANAFGVAQTAALNGTKFTVTHLGTEIIETGAALTAGVLLESDASGRVVPHATGVVVGRLAPGETADSAGRFVEVVLYQN